MQYSHALLINADYRPIKAVTWERAFALIYEGKAELVETFANKFLHSAKEIFEWPAVVRLLKFVQVRGKVRFKRTNVLSRDNYTCQYCGDRPTTKAGKPDLENLTIDHVVPRAQSRGAKVTLPWSKKEVAVTSWENVVAACYSCNTRKADRTPQQAGMSLVAHPKVPRGMEILRMSLTRIHIPDEWRAYLGKEVLWRDYWDADLASD